MQVKIQEAVWRVSRQPPPAGWRAENENLQQYESGLCFHSDRGETRFLPLGSDELPTEAQLRMMSLDDILPLWNRAKKR